MRATNNTPNLPHTCTMKRSHTGHGDSASASASSPAAALGRTTSSPAGGSSSASSSPSSPDSSPVKRLRTQIHGVAEEFVCPLTLSLPLDPVIASDGKLYDREAISEHIRRKPPAGGVLRSPVTNQPLTSTELIPAHQARSAIERLIETGAVGDDLADRWVRHQRDQHDAQVVKRRAEGGDVAAMRLLAGLYHHGQRGVERDVAESARWFRRAAEGGDACAMVMLGLFHVVGEVVEKNVTHGVSLVSVAAGMGSDFAALYLSKWYATGDHGLPKDLTKAKYWSRRILDGTCTIKDLTDDSRREAEAQLRDLHEEAAEDDDDDDEEEEDAADDTGDMDTSEH